MNYKYYYKNVILIKISKLLHIMHLKPYILCKKKIFKIQKYAVHVNKGQNMQNKTLNFRSIDYKSNV